MSNRNTIRIMRIMKKKSYLFAPYSEHNKIENRFIQLIKYVVDWKSSAVNRVFYKKEVT